MTGAIGVTGHWDRNYTLNFVHTENPITRRSDEAHACQWQISSASGQEVETGYGNV